MTVENSMAGRTESEQPDFSEVLLTAMEAGHILLENGAEVFRVEDTMMRIARHFGLQEEDFFVLSNGIFTTGATHRFGRQESFARVQHIPVHGTSLDKVVAVNQLSRDVEAGKYETLEEINARLKEIRQMPGKRKWVQMIASGIGAGCFALVFGGDFLDAAAAAVAGFLLYVFLLKLSIPVLHFSKITENVCGGALVSVLCLLFYKLGFGHGLNYMIVGAVIPLVPGVAFVNGIRDIADRDYLSGTVRLLDAILVFVCIAVGVGIVISLYQQFGGKIVL